MKINIYSIIILAAGKGKRMLNPSLAKVMNTVAGIPLLGHVLKQADMLNPDKIYIIIGHQKESIIAYINSLNKKNITLIEQKEQLGTGHAVMQAEKYLRNYSGDILILSGDVPLLKASTLNNFISEHCKYSADLSVLTTIAQQPSGYGRIIRNGNKDFIKIVEEKDASEKEIKINEINSGVYLIKSDLLFESLRAVRNNNAQGEYYLTDVVEILKKKNADIIAYNGAKFEELQGINSPEDLKRVEKYYSNNLIE